ncbi:energy-coupling factor transporter ATP-binding protein EcfA2 [Microbacterium proteolyticum]|uniref:Energy-coupling factor transporter ATP-binding protein EcfA2 n=1 Tax=Microbacterium proteolyticum TaxID=1572644 RepID=A0A7W5GDM2_9MICO|nr:hypothetical protein [Microbacterium proteolyticum]MBB3156624.1 energy-coupling factor transporter ATP-binding protein EcfA2 [Microbacterium proteolyticum]
MTPPPLSPLVVDALGVRVGIDPSGLTPTDRDTVARVWADARVVDPAPAEVVVAPVSSDRDGQTLSDLSGRVTQAAIDARRGELWMLHAAGLAASDGGVVVLVGPSGAGKTTATRLLARSWGYVSDETVGIESDGGVRGYRKPLSVITEGKGYKIQHAPRDLGLRPLPTAPLRVRRVVLLDRDRAHARARLVPVPASDALVLLAPHSSALASMPRPLGVVMSSLARTGGALRAEYSEAEQLVDLVGDLMVEDLDRRPEPDEASSAAVVSTPPSGASHGGGRRYRRGAVVDSCPLPDGRLAVMTGETDGRGTLRILAGVAPAILRAADDATRDDLLRAATDGTPDDEAARAVDGILDQLVEAGLLTVTSG